MKVLLVGVLFLCWACVSSAEIQDTLSEDEWNDPGTIPEDPDINFSARDKKPMNPDLDIKQLDNEDTSWNDPGASLEDPDINFSARDTSWNDPGASLEDPDINFSARDTSWNDPGRSPEDADINFSARDKKPMNPDLDIKQIDNEDTIWSDPATSLENPEINFSARGLSGSPDDFDQLVNKNCPYSDIARYNQYSAPQCAVKCIADPHCIGFTMNSRRQCYLKSQCINQKRQMHTVIYLLKVRRGPPSGFELLVNKNCPYHDIERYNQYAPTQCAEKCNAEPHCIGFVISQRRQCFLKSLCSNYKREMNTVIYLKDEGQSGSPSDFDQLENQNCPYSDIGRYNQYSAPQCAEKCIADPHCIGFVMNSGRQCYLKSQCINQRRVMHTVIYLLKVRRGPPSGFELLVNKNCPYHDIERYNQYAPTQCAEKCNAEPHCIGFVISQRRQCFLKSQCANHKREMNTVIYLKKEDSVVGCRTTVSGTYYTGRQDETKYGTPCVAWNNYPTWVAASEMLVSASNYCRNPDGDSCLWCFVNTNLEFQYCDVPMCGSSRRSVEEMQLSSDSNELTQEEKESSFVSNDLYNEEKESSFVSNDLYEEEKESSFASNELYEEEKESSFVSNDLTLLRELLEELRSDGENIEN